MREDGGEAVVLKVESNTPWRKKKLGRREKQERRGKRNKKEEQEKASPGLGIMKVEERVKVVVEVMKMEWRVVKVSTMGMEEEGRKKKETLKRMRKKKEGRKRRRKGKVSCRLRGDIYEQRCNWDSK